MIPKYNSERIKGRTRKNILPNDKNKVLAKTDLPETKNQFCHSLSILLSRE